MRRFALLTCLLMPALCGSPCPAGTIYVDDAQGDDAMDGRSARPSSEIIGPVRTIARGLELAKFADTLEIVNNGTPYYESIALFGRDHSGLPEAPFIIRSNGAVIDGTRPLEPGDWKQLSPTVWKVTPWRKGYYLLLQDDAPVTEFNIPAGSETLPALPQGQWAAWQGSIYYSADPAQTPDTLQMSLAQRDFGLSLVDVRNVRIEGLTFRHFRIDGVNLHTNAKNIRLERVTSVGNARAGISVNKDCQADLFQCVIQDNRVWQLLLTGRARATVEETDMSAPVKIIP